MGCKATWFFSHHWSCVWWCMRWWHRAEQNRSKQSTVQKSNSEHLETRKCTVMKASTSICTRSPPLSCLPLLHLIFACLPLSSYPWPSFLYLTLPFLAFTILPKQFRVQSLSLTLTHNGIDFPIQSNYALLFMLWT